MEDIVIVGHGGFAKEVAFLIEEINRRNTGWKLLGFISADQNDVGSVHGKYEIIRSERWLENVEQNLNVAIGIGNPAVLDKIRTRLKENKNLVFPNIIHPNAVFDPDGVRFGEGNIVCPGAIFTTNIVVGSFNIFNLACTVGHDVTAGDCNVFNPTVNVSGGITLGDRILIGTGAQILQNLRVCDDVVVGAGAVVTKNVEEPGTYVGIPARKLQK